MWLNNATIGYSDAINNNQCHYKSFNHDVGFKIKRLLTIKGYTPSICSIEILPHAVNSFVVLVVVQDF